MLSHNLDFNSCAIRDGFRKSSHICNNPKSFYKYIRSKQKVKNTTYQIENVDGIPANDDKTVNNFLKSTRILITFH